MSDENNHEEKKNIRVAVRVRPLNSREKKKGSCCEIHDRVQKDGESESKKRTVLRVACKASSRQRSSIPKTPKKVLKHPLLGKRTGPLKISTRSVEVQTIRVRFSVRTGLTNEQIFNDVVMDGVNHF